MIVVDSSVWIGALADAVNPQVGALFSISDRTQILLGDVIMLEVLRGVRSEAAARRVEADLRRFALVQMLNTEIAVRAAKNYRHLRSVGITIRNSVDLIIGTYCIEHGHQLLHRDRDFDHMEALGLKVYRPH
ncbi:MAG: PIN domain nuclease [Devosia sp.]|jgi:predicted nucleic acid-binding protein|nr:PIN domain nuclease [Devosia sp.]